MHSFDKKPQKEIQKKRLQNQSRVHNPYADIKQMSSLIGNQAMLSLLRSESHEGVGGEPFFEEMRAKFGQARKPEDRALGGTSLPDHLRDKFEKKPESEKTEPLTISPDLMEKAEEQYQTSLDGLKAYQDTGLRDSGFNGYARGNEIHIDSGLSPSEQERVVLHEVGHVVQRGSGMAHGSGFLDNAALERQADTGFAAPQGFRMPVSNVGPVMGDKFYGPPSAAHVHAYGNGEGHFKVGNYGRRMNYNERNQSSIVEILDIISTDPGYIGLEGIEECITYLCTLLDDQNTVDYLTQWRTNMDAHNMAIEHQREEQARQKREMKAKKKMRVAKPNKYK